MFQAGFAAAQSVVSAAGQVIMAVFGEVGKFIDAHSAEITAIFQMAWTTIQMVIRTAIMFIERVIAPALRDIARTRVDVRQVGARDEARLTADYERCGQYCCCKNFLKVLKPVAA
jgi:hypothetical protein